MQLVAPLRRFCIEKNRAAQRVVANTTGHTTQLVAQTYFTVYQKSIFDLELNCTEIKTKN
jgi:hypothetical protein